MQHYKKLLHHGPNNPGDVHFRGASNTAPAPLTKKSKSDHIRYVGYFFNLDLDWTYQADMITTKLRETLCTIQTTTFNSFDTISALNTVISGKLNYLLQIITPSPSQLKTWDTLIKEIARSKVSLIRSQPTPSDHSNQAHWQWGARTHLTV